jgi:predicted nucleic acid-binding protein
MDLLIAAHAMSVGAILVTNDAIFSQLEAVLLVVNWATDL